MIKYIRLINGEDIVSDVEIKDTSYVLNNPAVVKIVETGDPERPIQNRVEPFALHAKKRIISIDSDKILFVTDPIISLEEYYAKTYLGDIPSSPSELVKKASFDLTEEEKEKVEAVS